MTDLPAALAPEHPCRPCQDDHHEGCTGPVLTERAAWWGCCCDDVDRDPDPPRWHP